VLSGELWYRTFVIDLLAFVAFGRAGGAGGGTTKEQARQ
jgi:hypothetical protein